MPNWKDAYEMGDDGHLRRRVDDDEVVRDGQSVRVPMQWMDGDGISKARAEAQRAYLDKCAALDRTMLRGRIDDGQPNVLTDYDPKADYRQAAKAAWDARMKMFADTMRRR